MEVFGPAWKEYPERIQEAWKGSVAEDDLVLIPGDISWAMRLEGAAADLEWIDALPGKKLILKGNHDYWWPSNKKLKEALPASIDFIHNTATTWEGVTIGGSRLWDTPEFSFEEIIEFQENPFEKKKEKPSREDTEAIYVKELGRLRKSLEKLDPSANLRVAMTHYPPIGYKLEPSRAASLLEEFKIDICVFGHLHSVKQGIPLFGKKNGVEYVFASADYIDFKPIRLR